MSTDLTHDNDASKNMDAITEMSKVDSSDSNSDSELINDLKDEHFSDSQEDIDEYRQDVQEELSDILTELEEKLDQNTEQEPPPVDAHVDTAEGQENGLDVARPNLDTLPGLRDDGVSGSSGNHDGKESDIHRIDDQSERTRVERGRNY